MQRTEALEFAKILQAWGNGKPVQVLSSGMDVANDVWLDIMGENYRFNPERKYRLKPEPFRCIVVVDELTRKVVKLCEQRFVALEPTQRIAHMVEEQK